jgi:hypothetical protein
MRIIFLVRKRQHENTAIANAARLDGQRLANEGHDVAIVELVEGEVLHSRRQQDNFWRSNFFLNLTGYTRFRQMIDRVWKLGWLSSA